MKKVRLVSLKDSVDLETPGGRLIANVLASVAATKRRFAASGSRQDRRLRKLLANDGEAQRKVGDSRSRMKTV